MTLEGENQESARFGSTVVNIGDINGDGTDGMFTTLLFLFAYLIVKMHCFDICLSFKQIWQLVHHGVVKMVMVLFTFTMFASEKFSTNLHR